MVSARARGRLGGKPKALNKKQIEMAKKLVADPANRISDVCDQFKISRTTLFRYTKPANPKQKAFPTGKAFLFPTNSLPT
ncbi:MAG TPA: helix-turn-helix domain-containing protein [Pyrinomonadaceae bacterium]|nr:helix-turn-helix domain-containing protein [Pyrinomonadaceae bacterium]